MTCKGVVRGNTVCLEGKARLPEGAAVEVRVLDPWEVEVVGGTPAGASTDTSDAESVRDEDPFKALLVRRAANAGLRVNMDEIIEEEKQDREERFDHWLFP